MEPFAPPPHLLGSIPVESSEEARIAQFRRIDELENRIGDHSTWLQQQPDHGILSSNGIGSVFDMSSAASSAIGPPNIGAGPPKLDAVAPAGLIDRSLLVNPLPEPPASHETATGLFADHAADDERNGSSSDANQSHPLSAADDSSQSRFRDGNFSASTKSPNSSTFSSDLKIKSENEDVMHGISTIYPDSVKTTPPLATAPQPVKSEKGSQQSPAHPAKRRRIAKDTKQKVSDFRARTAFPSDISSEELARQSIEAALASRLNPFVLHPNEYSLLREHICHLHVTAYLSTRNRILRLWVRNPLAAVTPEEAAGSAAATKWLGLAEVAYEWLLRNGYVNFGCVEIPSTLTTARRKSKSSRRTIVVIGAGMSGLGCARQLEGLFSHYSDQLAEPGQEPPRVILLEGRPRIGGRIYSHPLQNQVTKRIPKSLRCTAELGAHIITGFDHGNPMNMIIRGQLALHYYSLKDNSSLYDVDGKVVNRERDRLVEQLFNDILDRASVFRHKLNTPATVEGDRSLIEAGKEPAGDADQPISVVEIEKNAVINQPEKLSDKGLDQVPGGMDKLTGKAMLVTGSRSKMPAAVAAQKMGWALASPALAQADIDLEKVANSCAHPTLGQAMDEAIKQYQALLHLSPQDLRLLNWHFANLEYANAANVNKLSLGGWDQDIGNEFEGEHAQVVGGYTQVPYGILQSPQPLDLRTRKVVRTVSYSPEKGPQARAQVECEDGEVIQADHVVLTAPLGVLKDGTINFNPALPDWKSHSIEHLGFGVLNKVILVYERAFWDVDQDMIGLLRDTDLQDSDNQDDYSANRGRFYLFWNCIKTSGRPLLIALMAGDAAVQAEARSDGEVVAEVQHQLCKMFRHKSVPAPLETIVTRWGRDRFARGTYSYVGPSAHSDDYDAMARPVGNLHFAGEATCGTHPATVHGAYISGLRAASEVIMDMLGPIRIPEPLILPTATRAEAASAPLGKPLKPVSTSSSRGGIRPDEVMPNGETYGQKQARLEAFEQEILAAIFQKLGPRPDKPGRSGANPFLLFSKDKWAECKARCDSARRAAVGNAEAKASRNEVRAALGQMWREAGAEVKRPYLERTQENKASNQENAASFQSRLAAWDAEAMATRRGYVAAHPGVLSEQEEQDMWQALGVFAGQERRAKRESGYAEEGRERGMQQEGQPQPQEPQEQQQQQPPQQVVEAESGPGT